MFFCLSAVCLFVSGVSVHCLPICPGCGVAQMTSIAAAVCDSCHLQLNDVCQLAGCQSVRQSVMAGMHGTMQPTSMVIVITWGPESASCLAVYLST